MHKNHELSRQVVVGSLAAGSILPTAAVTAEVSSSLIDARLIDLGRQFHELVEHFDNAGQTAGYSAEEFFVRLERVEAEILSIPAKSIDGYRVKARAACWALLGDIDPHSCSTTDRRMAMSIVRDLIQQYDPELEQPGALKELVADLD
jgi:hypothetical protein